MNIVDHYSRTVSFGPYGYEELFVLPTSKISNLLDINIAINGQTAYFGNPDGRAVRDARVYFDGTEITSALTSAIKSNLDKLDQQRLKSQYSDALKKEIALKQKMNEFYHNVHIAEAEKTADELLARVPLSSNLDQLGGASLGYQGDLHIFNFLYSQIDLFPVSLMSLLPMPENGGKKTLIEYGEVRLVFSAGPSRFYSDQWKPLDVEAQGAVHYGLDCVYHNPMDDILRSLQDDISSRLDQIGENVGTNGVIQGKILPDIAKHLQYVIDRIDESKNLVASEKEQLKDLTAALNDLKNSLNQVI